MSDYFAKQSYESIRAANPELGLDPWDALPEDKKDKVRASQRQYEDEMNELGRKISSGEIATGLTVRKV